MSALVSPLAFCSNWAVTVSRLLLTWAFGHSMSASYQHFVWGDKLECQLLISVKHYKMHPELQVSSLNSFCGLSSRMTPISIQRASATWECFIICELFFVWYSFLLVPPLSLEMIGYNTVKLILVWLRFCRSFQGVQETGLLKHMFVGFFFSVLLFTGKGTSFVRIVCSGSLLLSDLYGDKFHNACPSLNLHLGFHGCHAEEMLCQCLADNISVNAAPWCYSQWNAPPMMYLCMVCLCSSVIHVSGSCMAPLNHCAIKKKKKKLWKYKYINGHVLSWKDQVSEVFIMLLWSSGLHLHLICYIRALCLYLYLILICNMLFLLLEFSCLRFISLFPSIPFLVCYYQCQHFLFNCQHKRQPQIGIPFIDWECCAS